MRLVRRINNKWFVVLATLGLVVATATAPGLKW
jgi:hypothetical protein